MGTISDDEDEPVFEVPKKRKQEKAKKPSVNVSKKKKKNNKNNGLLQESRFMESDTDSD